jgi:hypothetical protein
MVLIAQALAGPVCIDPSFEPMAAKERKERRIVVINLVGRVRLGIGMPSYVA